MIKSKIALVALVTAVGIASPALAQSRHVYRNDIGSSTQVINPDSPALTGGGSLGGNELADHDFE